jgi:hypothetical protein
MALMYSGRVKGKLSKVSMPALSGGFDSTTRPFHTTLDDTLMMGTRAAAGTEAGR